MKKYYTRACNFYYGTTSKNLIKKKITLPLAGSKSISFNNIEIFIRQNKTVKSKIINIKDIKNQNNKLRKKLNDDLKKIVSKRKYFNEPMIMGILNMTPDSFSDGGKFIKKKSAITQINKMIESGANIIDVGGESTRPGSVTISFQDEWARIGSIIKIFKKKYPRTLLSIDTRKSEIIKKSINYKTDIINDVSGFNFDKQSILEVKNKNLWKVVHHMKGTPATMQVNPKYNNVLLDIYDFFENKIKSILKEKKYADKIIIDPGIGFGKNLKHNLMLLSKISLFHSLGFPILIGTSRKRFISEISGNFDTKERIGGTLSSITFTLSQGVQIFRVHNVEEVKQGIEVYKKILNQ